MSTMTMTTNHGDIVFEMFDDDAPKTVGNMRELAEKGYYDGLTFHRIITDFMIQGGCPQGTGTGGPGYEFEDEFNDHKVVRGALAMANAGPNTNGSQFFIVTVGAAPWLDGKHTVFGEVTSGMDVVDALEGAAHGRARPPARARGDREAQLQLTPHGHRGAAAGCRLRKASPSRTRPPARSSPPSRCCRPTRWPRSPRGRARPSPPGRRSASTGAAGSCAARRSGSTDNQDRIVETIVVRDRQDPRRRAPQRDPLRGEPRSASGPSTRPGTSPTRRSARPARRSPAASSSCATGRSA